MRVFVCIRVCEWVSECMAVCLHLTVCLYIPRKGSVFAECHLPCTDLAALTVRLGIYICLFCLCKANTLTFLGYSCF